jgi:tetratricopeptide (TPR) repeat protein
MILILAAAMAAPAPPAATPGAACPNVVTVEAFVCRALTASKGGDSRAAAEAFDQAALAQANEAERTRLLAAAGNMWIAANEPGKAALSLDQALRGTSLQAEQRGEALLDRARAAEAQNDLKTARAKIGEAAQTIPEDPFLWYFSAALAIRENDAVTAKQAIGKALSLAPNDPTVLFEAGHVYHFANDDAGARTYWSRAATADPNGKSGAAAKEALALLSQPPVQKQAAPPK